MNRTTVIALAQFARQVAMLEEKKPVDQRVAMTAAKALVGALIEEHPEHADLMRNRIGWNGVEQHAHEITDWAMEEIAEGHLEFQQQERRRLLYETRRAALEQVDKTPYDERYNELYKEAEQKIEKLEKEIERALEPKTRFNIERQIEQARRSIYQPHDDFQKAVRAKTAELLKEQGEDPLEDDERLPVSV